MATGGATIDTDGGHTITTGYDSEPQTGSQKIYVKDGVSMVSSEGQGNPFHVLPEYQDISNQQTENIDLLLMAADFSDRLGPLEKPDPRNFSEWIKLGKSLLELAKDNKLETGNEANSNDPKGSMIWQYNRSEYFDTMGSSRYINRFSKDSFMHYNPNANSSDDPNQPDTGKVTIFKSPK